MPRTITILAAVWLASWAVAVQAAPSTPADGPSFDCAKATSGVAKLVCGDAQLSALDQETARLYKLAASGPSINAKQRAALKAAQRGWVRGREDCTKASNARACVVAAYASRIHELRGAYPATRAGDTLSRGPFAVTCPGVQAKMSATFINTPPDLVQLQWGDRQLTLTQGMSASGVRYIGSGPDGDYVFWEKGREALFSRPGSPDVQCQIKGG